MRKRWRLLLSIIAVIVPLVVLGVYLAVPPKPGVTLENFHRLSLDMTRQEAESILGKPSRLPQGQTAEVTGNVQWVADTGTVNICFEDDLAVFGAFANEAGVIESLQQQREGVFDRVRQWVKDWTGW